MPPRAWRGLVPRAAPWSRTKDKGRGRQPEGGRARKVRPISEGNANAAGAEGSPSLAACQRQGRSPFREAPLTLGKGEACGETAPAPYWVGAGAAAPKQVKRGNSFADETQQGRRLTPTTAATTFGGSLIALAKKRFRLSFGPLFLAWSVAGAAYIRRSGEAGASSSSSMPQPQDATTKRDYLPALDKLQQGTDLAAAAEPRPFRGSAELPLLMK